MCEGTTKRGKRGAQLTLHYVPLSTALSPLPLNGFSPRAPLSCLPPLPCSTFSASGVRSKLRVRSALAHFSCAVTEYFQIYKKQSFISQSLLPFSIFQNNCFSVTS